MRLGLPLDKWPLLADDAHPVRGHVEAKRVDKHDLASCIARNKQRTLDGSGGLIGEVGRNENRPGAGGSHMGKIYAPARRLCASPEGSRVLPSVRLADSAVMACRCLVD